MTTRRRAARLAADNPCPTCGGTGVARRSPGSGPSGHLTVDASADATAEMLRLADQFATEAETAAADHAATVLPAERTARQWAAVLGDDLTGPALVSAIQAASDAQ